MYHMIFFFFFFFFLRLNNKFLLNRDIFDRPILWIFLTNLVVCEIDHLRFGESLNPFKICPCLIKSYKEKPVFSINIANYFFLPARYHDGKS